jgi:hypothetical protein
MKVSKATEKGLCILSKTDRPVVDSFENNYELLYSKVKE